jgi:hypothetical protein
MKSNPMSDTPRTDLVIKKRWEIHSCEEVPADFARQLEREIDALRAEIQELKFELTDWRMYCDSP